jgi:hypothetical protein
MKTLNNRYNVPSNLPLDQYGHVSLPDAKTDPYGDLEYVVGSGDDFICFDWAFFSHEGRNYVALHGTLNSETGSFIQDHDYTVLDWSGDMEGEALSKAYAMVSSALDWCAENDVRHDKTGWNQDAFYFIRSLARGLYRHGIESEGIAALSRQAPWFRFGSKTLNREIMKISPAISYLPVTKKPRA